MSLKLADKPAEGIDDVEGCPLPLRKGRGGGETKGASSVLTVNKPLHVVIASPQVGRLVHGSRFGGEAPSSDARDPRSPHRLLQPLLVPARTFVWRLAAAAVTRRVRAAALPIFLAAFLLLLLLGTSELPARGRGQSAPFGGPSHGRGPVTLGPQCAGQCGAHRLQSHFFPVKRKHTTKLLQHTATNRQRVKTQPSSHGGHAPYMWPRPSVKARGLFTSVIYLSVKTCTQEN